MNQRRTREAWIADAVELLRPMIEHDAGRVVPAVRVSCGDLGRKRAGTCYPGAWVADGVIEVAVSLRHEPLAVDVLGTVAHEVLHAAGIRNHQRDFQKAARVLGLVTRTGKWTDAGFDGIERGDLPGWADSMLCALGDWPAPKMTPADRPKRQTTRMIKVTCESCSIVWRAAGGHLRDGVRCPAVDCPGPAVIHPAPPVITS